MGLKCGKFNKKENSDLPFQRIFTYQSKENLSEFRKIDHDNKNNIKSIYFNSLNKSNKKSDDNSNNKNNDKIEDIDLINVKNNKQQKLSHVQNLSDYSNFKLSNITGNSFKSNFFKHEKILKIVEKFYLSNEDINNLHNFFTKIDTENTGTISIIDIYKLLEENPSTSIISPFIDRFFILIEKKNFYKITFEEFIPNLISFCLFSTFQLIEFMFNFIDKDHDCYISKNDIKNILLLKREETDIFLLNYKTSLKNIRVRRIDKINLEEFFEICKKLPFIFHPLINLQEKLREKCIGKKFWEKLNIEVKEKYTKKLKILESEKINNQINNIHDKLIQEKKLKLKIHKEEENKIYNEKIRMERRNSDTAFFIGKYDKLKEIEMNKYKEAKSFDEKIFEVLIDNSDKN